MNTKIFFHAKKHYLTLLTILIAGPALIIGANYLLGTDFWSEISDTNITLYKLIVLVSIYQGMCIYDFDDGISPLTDIGIVFVCLFFLAYARFFQLPWENILFNGGSIIEVPTLVMNIIFFNVIGYYYQQCYRKHNYF